ncbi:MAG: glycosyltransferase family 9 protein [Candidatus Wallbacteria bacterium]|nr:glycosyltransferase family 9 protein [Candidatus Wallbacteria bacterium]
MATPLFARIMTLFPDAECHLFLREDTRFRELAEQFGFTSVSYFKKKIGILEFTSLASKLRRMKFDRVFVLREGIKYKFLALLLCIPARVMGQGLLWVKGHPYPDFAHFTTRFFLLHPVIELSESALGSAYRITITNQAYASSDSFLAGLNLKHPLALINPGSWELSKRWPLEHFITLAEMMVRKRLFSPVFTLGPFESKLEAAVTEKGFPIFKGGSLTELAALTDRASVFVTSDTGPMHIACCTRARVAAIINRRAVMTVRPLQSGAIILSTEPDCSMKCENCAINCLEKITPSQVLDSIEKSGKGPGQ